MSASRHIVIFVRLDIRKRLVDGRPEGTVGVVGVWGVLELALAD